MKKKSKIIRIETVCRICSKKMRPTNVTVNQVKGVYDLKLDLRNMTRKTCIVCGEVDCKEGVG